MSELHQIVLEAVLDAVLGCWAAMLLNVLKDSPKALKAFLFAVSVIVFVTALGLIRSGGGSVLDGMIGKNAVSIPLVAGLSAFYVAVQSALMNQKVRWLVRLLKGTLALIQWISIKLAMYLFSFVLILFFRIPVAYPGIVGLLCGFALSVALPFLFTDNATFTGILAVSNGFALFLFAGAFHLLVWPTAALAACVAVWIEYEALSFLYTRRFSPPPGVFLWIAGAFAELFT